MHSTPKIIGVHEHWLVAVTKSAHVVQDVNLLLGYEENVPVSINQKVVSPRVFIVVPKERDQAICDLKENQGIVLINRVLISLNKQQICRILAVQPTSAVRESPTINPQHSSSRDVLQKRIDSFSYLLERCLPEVFLRRVHVHGVLILVG